MLQPQCCTFHSQNGQSPELLIFVENQKDSSYPSKQTHPQQSPGDSIALSTGQKSTKIYNTSPGLVTDKASKAMHSRALPKHITDMLIIVRKQQQVAHRGHPVTTTHKS